MSWSKMHIEMVFWCKHSVMTCELKLSTEQSHELPRCSCLFVLYQMDALPYIVEAVKGRCEIYVDGGFRCGTDILKALSIGARMVFMGRPMFYALVQNVRHELV